MATQVLLFEQAKQSRLMLAKLGTVVNHPGKPPHTQKDHGRKKKLDLPDAPTVVEEQLKTPAKRRTRRKPPDPTSDAGPIGALPRTGRAETPSAAAKAVNPSFGSTVNGPTYPGHGKAGKRWTAGDGPMPSGAYEENCTNAVNAFEMRMRGYDVTAAPLDVVAKSGYAAGRTFAETDQLFADAWRLPNGKPHGRSFDSQQWRSFAEIDSEIERDWPDGGRGVITVGKHIFNAMKMNGKARYIEAQFDATPTRNVTSLYQRKYRGSRGWREC